MNLAQDIYLHLGTISWLTNAGQELRPQFEFPSTYAENRDASLDAFHSNSWADAKTEAQGDLNGYLAKHHYASYGGHWNNLAKQSRALVESTVKCKLADALNRGRFPLEMIQPILVDLNRAALGNYICRCGRIEFFGHVYA